MTITTIAADRPAVFARGRSASSLAASQPLSAPTFPRWKGPAGHLSKTTLAALVALLAVLVALVAPGIASGLTGSTADLVSGVAAASAEAPPGIHGPAGETRVRASNLADGTRVGVNSAESASTRPGSTALYDQTASGWLVAPRAPAIAGGSDALKLSETVAGHAASRPYVNSRLLVDEIMGAGKPIPDPGGLRNGLRWDVPGTRWNIGEGARGASRGTWELVVDADTGTIVHFLFRGGQ